MERNYTSQAVQGIQYGDVQAQRGTDEPLPRDLATHLQSVHGIVFRAHNIGEMLSAQLGRLYGEGDPPSPEGRVQPPPVGLHHEMTTALNNLEALMAIIESRADRLSRYV